MTLPSLLGQSSFTSDYMMDLKLKEISRNLKNTKRELKYIYKWFTFVCAYYAHACICGHTYTRA